MQCDAKHNHMMIRAPRHQYAAQSRLNRTRVPQLVHDIADRYFHHWGVAPIDFLPKRDGGRVSYTLFQAEYAFDLRVAILPTCSYNEACVRSAEWYAPFIRGHAVSRR